MIRSRYISDAEVTFLRYALRIDNDFVTIKRALQRLCTHYEKKLRLFDPTDIRQLVHSHLGSGEVWLRRWSMKALGLIGHPDDTARLFDRLRIEQDHEAQTWCMAAILKNADDRGVPQICSEAKLENSVPLLLAARLYAPEKWLSEHWKPITISLNDDDLVLKWAIFLAGYNKAPALLFHPRYENNVFLGELNCHSTNEISEYSIWALWERKDCGVKDLKVSAENFLNHPENARKWLYRIGLQTPDHLLIDPDCLDDFRRKEPTPSAREGLALGVSDLIDARFDDATLNWFDAEPAESVKEILLGGMAVKSDTNADFADTVARHFQSASADSNLRKKLLVASEGTKLNQILRKSQLEAELSRQGLFEFGNRYNLNVQGDIIVAGAKFSAGRDIKAANLVGGDVIGSALSSVQNIAPERTQDREFLTAVLDFLKSSAVPDSHRATVTAAVEDVAKDPTPEKKSGLVSALKGIAETIGAVAGLTSLIELAQDWLG